MTPKEKKPGAAFRELLSLFLYTDNRFPFFEATAFLLVACALLFGQIPSNSDAGAFTFTAGFSGLSITTVIFLVVVLKNLASGFGGEFDKGTMQTLLNYPLGRGRLLLARLTSAVVLVVGLLAIVEFGTAALISPTLVAQHFPMLMSGFLTSLSVPLLIAAVATLLVMVSKSGGVALAVGLTAYFGIVVLSAFLIQWGFSLQNRVAVLVVYLLNPAYSFMQYFGQGAYCGYPCFLSPPSLEASAVILISNLVITLSIFALGALYFTRRLEV